MLKNIFLLLFIIITGLLASLNSQAYILPAKLILDFSGQRHGTVPYKVFLTTTLTGQDAWISWNETLIVKTKPFMMSITAQATDKSWSFSKVYHLKKEKLESTTWLEGKRQKNRLSKFSFLPFLFYKNVDAVSSLFKAFDIDTTDLAAITPILTRNQGVVSLLLTGSETSEKQENETKEKQKNGLWFNQDQFFLQKIKQGDFVLDLTKHKRFRYGLWLSQSWSGSLDGEDAFQTQVISVTRVERSELRRLKNKQAPKPIGAPEAKVLDFYKKFR